MNAVTIEQVIAWQPCGVNDDDDGVNYTPQQIERLFAGRDTVTAEDIAALPIPKEDIIWALLHEEIVTEREMHLMACDFAESVVSLCGDDPRPQAAIDAKRLWINGEISDSELAEARDAARAEARDAAWAEARAAAWAAQIKAILSIIQERGNDE